MSFLQRTILMLTICFTILSLYTALAWANTHSSPEQTKVQTIHPARALWLWNTRELVLNPTKRAELFQFIMAPKGVSSVPIKRLFFSVSWAISPLATRAEQIGLANFLIEAHQLGLKVDMLAGTPKWANSVLGPALEQLLQNLTQWQRATVLEVAPNSLALARFDGLQLDVEPYLLKPEWPSQRLFDAWVSMAQQVYTYFSSNADLGLAFGLALPIWLDQEKYNNLHEPLQIASDYIALMDYRDTASRIIRDAENELLVADRLKKAVFVGVEVKQVTGDPPSITFFEEGNAVMERELKVAEADFITHPSFAGFAIHQYEAYQALKP